MLVTQTIRLFAVMPNGFAVSPFDPPKWRSIVATTVFVEGSIRSTVPSSAFATQRAPARGDEDGFTPLGLWPTRTKRAWP